MVVLRSRTCVVIDDRARRQGYKPMNRELAQLHHQVDGFVMRWSQFVYDHCDSSQKTALFLLWFRFFRALRALHHLLDNEDWEDCFTLARVCLECDVSMDAILRDATLGERYIEYRKHARNRFLTAMRRTRPVEDIVRADERMRADYC